MADLSLGLTRAAEIVQAEIDRAEALLSIEDSGGPVFNREQTEAGICALRAVLAAIQQQIASGVTGCEMIDDSDRLKPCAHCGADEASVQQALNGGYLIECGNPVCGITTYLMYATGDDPIPLLMEKWNRRPAGVKAVGLALPLPAGDSRVSALRWLLNITTEFDRKDVRTRQAARLLDEFSGGGGRTNRELLEDLWRLVSGNAGVTGLDAQTFPPQSPMGEK